jgi:hypothetical protein
MQNSSQQLLAGSFQLANCNLTTIDGERGLLSIAHHRVYDARGIDRGIEEVSLLRVKGPVRALQQHLMQQRLNAVGPVRDEAPAVTQSVMKLSCSHTLCDEAPAVTQSVIKLLQSHRASCLKVKQ